MKRRVISTLLVAGALACGLAPAVRAAAAPGAPGTQSYFDLARKDCVGTARDAGSKVWFTVAGGVLSDVYWPNVDATNVKTLQYEVSDGRSFTDLQTRDMTYRSFSDPTGMACTVVASSSAHHYRLVTTYLADPARDAVLMRTRFEGPAADQVYVRLEPLAGGTGGGGDQNSGANSAKLDSRRGDPVPVAFNTNTVTQAVNRDYAVPTFEALQSSGGFSAASVGYAGTSSDGQQLLDSDHALTRFHSAPNGHVALTARLRLRGDRDVSLALGFGTTENRALRTADQSVDQPFTRAWTRYDRQWQRYDSSLRRPSPRLGQSVARQYYRSVNVVKASEDKTFSGAIAAGLASPWGQAVPAGNATNGKPTYFGSYREVFARDLYEAFTGLLVAGDLRTARAATRFLFDRQQQSDGSMPRNSLLNGKVAPDTGGLQLDETSYPILMDWQSGLAGNRRLYRDHVVPAADFLVAHGPSDGVERWEEQSGYSPSTISAEIAGLTAAASIARVNGDSEHAAVYQATADDFARNIKNWTVTTTGPYGSSYFIRLSKTGDPNVASPYNLGNGSVMVDQRSVIDAGFLELVRLGVLPASDPTIASSLAVVDRVIERQTPSGTGFYRYGTDATGSEDGYGDCYEPDPTNCTPTGKPWPTNNVAPGQPTPNVGSGHLWPVLAGERGEFDVASGDRGQAATLLDAISNMTSGGYLEPEQAWEDPAVAPSPFGSDPTTASIGFEPGQPTGSASPLTWAQATYARLAVDLGAGRNLETPQIVSDRYVAHGMPGSLPLTIGSPAAGTTIDSSSVTVSGTTTARARRSWSSRGDRWDRRRSRPRPPPTPPDAWSVPVPVELRPATITATRTLAPPHRLRADVGHQRLVPGTTVFSATDPTGDDNGPGTYGYPTSGDFTPGAFDLEGMQVNQTATDVFIQFKLRDLDPDVRRRTSGRSCLTSMSAIRQDDHVDGGAVPVAQVHDRARRWLERAARGPGIRAALVWADAVGLRARHGQLVVDRRQRHRH